MDSHHLPHDFCHRTQILEYFNTLTSIIFLGKSPMTILAIQNGERIRK
jgi:hypothetical protein